jgi:Domain of unknown function (DUF4349)
LQHDESLRDDLLNVLREARPMAPAELREHVRRIAAEATPEPRHGIRWRRVVVVAAPLAAAVAGAVILFPDGKTRPQTGLTYASPPARKAANPTELQTLAPSSGAASDQAALPAPAPDRVQRITTTLELRLPNTQAVSDATKQAVAITRSLGGYPKALNVDAEGRTGYASLVLRIPKQNVQRAVSRLSGLGTIVGENVQIQDIQAQVDAAARKIHRLQARRAYWQAQSASEEAAQHVAALTTQIAKLRRGRANTIKTASYATVSVQMTTKPAPVPAHKGQGPLHNLGVAFWWIGIVAVYVLALAAPFVVLGVLFWLLFRAVRRHREAELLSAP